MKQIVVDFEMNQIAKHFRKERDICKMEIIEIGAVMLDEEGAEIDSYKAYVKYGYNTEITKKISELTGITDGKLQGEPHFNRAFEKFVDWCLQSKDVVVYAWSESDLVQVTREMELKKYPMTEKERHLLANWRDLQAMYSEKLGLETKPSLEKALNDIGTVFEGKKHDALWDARNTADILRALNDEKELELLRKAICDVVTQEEELTASLGSMIDFGKLMEAVE